jgi:mono/diheme cytochrome c family protein
MRGSTTFVSVAVVVLWGTASMAVAYGQRAATAPAGNLANGKQLYTRMNCSYCHGTEGQGSAAGVGPRIAHVSRSFDSFTRYVRRPSGRMTGYSEKILTDAELADIYAFLRSLPPAKPVAEIPLLDQLRGGVRPRPPG